MIFDILSTWRAEIVYLGTYISLYFLSERIALYSVLGTLNIFDVNSYESLYKFFIPRFLFIHILSYFKLLPSLNIF